MDLNKFTQKAQEAVIETQSLAGEYSHGQIEPLHLLLALLRQSDGIVPQIIQIDEIVLFRSLTKADLLQIVDIQTRHLRELLAERHIGLELNDAARQHLADVGYDPVYGARPFKRVIQREVQDPLALALLRSEFAE